MRTVPSALQTYIDSRSTEVVRLFELTRNDGTVFRFTDNDLDLVIGPLTYRADLGVSTSAIVTALYQGFSGGTITVIMSDDGFNEIDLRSGAYDNASILVMFVDRRNLAADMIAYGGIINNVVFDDDDRVELQVKSRLFGDRYINVETYSPTCRADLGDERCKVDIDELKYTGTVFEEGTLRRWSFTVNKLGFNDFITSLTTSPAWALGVVRFTDGPNEGQAFEIASIKDDPDFETASRVRLAYSAPFPISVGDGLEIWPGCNKSLDMCRNTYHNVVNNRSEPFFMNSIEDETSEG